MLSYYVKQYAAESFTYISFRPHNNLMRMVLRPSFTNGETETQQSMDNVPHVRAGQWQVPFQASALYTRGCACHQYRSRARLRYYVSGTIRTLEHYQTTAKKKTDAADKCNLGALSPLTRLFPIW